MVIYNLIPKLSDFINLAQELSNFDSLVSKVFDFDSLALLEDFGILDSFARLVFDYFTSIWKK